MVPLCSFEFVIFRELCVEVCEDGTRKTSGFNVFCHDGDRPLFISRSYVVVGLSKGPVVTQQ
jgi:hypothetical protein